MKKSTENIYKQKVNQIIDYINSNLHQPLQLNVIADKMNISQRQLLRIMDFALNEPLYTYIARLRIERAVLYMQTEEMCLQKLAALVGYGSSQSFSKAFKKQFGISPKSYIATLKARLKETLYNNNEHNLQSEICNFSGLNLVYIRIYGKYGEENEYKTAWEKLINFMNNNELIVPETRFIGLSFDDPNITCPNQCRYYACASIQKNIMPTAEFGTIKLPQGKYAVYVLNGSYSKLGVFHDLIRQSNEHTLRFGIIFDEYLNCFDSESPENLVTKVYIPIK